MLKLKHKLHLDFPHVTFHAPQPMHLSPVTDDEDEIVQDISKDPQTHEDDWQLTERPDTDELIGYWDKVEKDVQNDPEWINFSGE